MRRDYSRSERIEHLLAETLAELLMRRIKDPRVAGVTITGVSCTPDLRHAVVYIGAARRGQEGEQDALEGVQSAVGFLRGELGRKLRMRYVPQLSVELDRSLDEAQRIETIIAKLHEGESGHDDDAP